MLISSLFFTRWISLIYLIAFWSLGLQVLGLIGSHGILPAADFLHYVSQQQGINPYWAVPTLCWLNTSDWFLLFLAWGGVGLSVLLLIGVMPFLTAFFLWLFYLSLTVVGQDFLGFQWDNLLLEAGFLLIFLMPVSLQILNKPSFRPSLIVIWLFRWLLFRLMFESGMVKLLSKDVHWANLTAMTYHYWTQPLPNMISWYANQLPLWFQKASCASMFFIELVLPFLIFLGRWPRLIAFFGITGLQLLIILTGNYGFFNLLAIGLSLTLLEDEHYLVIAGPKFEAIPERTTHSAEIASPFGFAMTSIVNSILAVLVLTVSLSLMSDSFLHQPPPKPLERLITAVSPFRSINNYGLFAVMTTQRNEINIEGSDDGEHWKPYEFYFKPGNVNQSPRLAWPYQPRLDWQMWFASLGSWQENQWVMSLIIRLLQGESSVESLLGNNPFPNHPPKYIQASFWGYHFTDFKTKKVDGAWWHREIKGLYCPTLSKP